MTAAEILIVVSAVLCVGMVICFSLMIREVNRIIKEQEAKEPPKPTDPWYPGSDGVDTVEDMWRFYLARGDEITKLREERDEIQRVFDMQWKADMEAIELWQAENPGNDHVWPDRRKLTRWLIDQIPKKDS